MRSQRPDGPVEPPRRPASSFSSRTCPRQARQTRVQALLADFHGLLVVGAEEAVGAVLLHGLPAVLPDIEHCGGKGDDPQPTPREEGATHTRELSPEKDAKPTCQRQPERGGAETRTPGSGPPRAGQPPQTQLCSWWPAFPELVSHGPGATSFPRPCEEASGARCLHTFPRRAREAQIGHSPADPAARARWKRVPAGHSLYDTRHWAPWGQQMPKLVRPATQPSPGRCKDQS